MIFRLFNDYERFFMVYNKKSKQLHRTYIEGAPEIGREKAKKMDTFFDDLFSGLYVNPQYQSMGKAIALVPASDICGRKQEILDFIDKHPSAKSSLLKQIIQEMTDDHNPLMVVITFK